MFLVEGYMKYDGPILRQNSRHTTLEVEDLRNSWLRPSPHTELELLLLKYGLTSDLVSVGDGSTAKIAKVPLSMHHCKAVDKNVVQLRYLMT